MCCPRCGPCLDVLCAAHDAAFVWYGTAYVWCGTHAESSVLCGTHNASSIQCATQHPDSVLCATKMWPLFGVLSHDAASLHIDTQDAAFVWLGTHDAASVQCYHDAFFCFVCHWLCSMWLLLSTNTPDAAAVHGLPTMRPLLGALPKTQPLSCELSKIQPLFGELP